jgi:E3 ubiquitin-protein ligase DMA1/2
MFSQPANAPPSSSGLPASAAHPSTAPSQRTSRLRGLTYLRLLNRDHSSSNATSGVGTTAGANHNSHHSSTSAVVRSTAAVPTVTRSSSHASIPEARFSLVATSSHPLAASSPPVTRSTAEPNGPAEAMTRTRSATDAGAASQAGLDSLPSIRFSTFYDARAVRPSLTFSPVTRTLPTGHEVIRVGRYSERDSQPSVPANMPSAAPVGFKSKVVSRRHCEFWCEAGKWFIKDVKSSSGTFLNHIRLSAPGTESKPFAVNDGDIVQLGIDFKGGEEMIFRCVKMRLELNRGWQNKLNAFKLAATACFPRLRHQTDIRRSMTTHKRLRNMTKSTDADSSVKSSQDCSICLNSIAVSISFPFNFLLELRVWHLQQLTLVSRPPSHASACSSRLAHTPGTTSAFGLSSHHRNILSSFAPIAVPPPISRPKLRTQKSGNSWTPRWKTRTTWLRAILQTLLGSTTWTQPYRPRPDKR